MKIAEIIGSVADQEHEPAPVSGFMQRVANAFTPSGRVKRPLDYQGLGEQPTTTVPSSASVPASEEGTSMVPSADAVANAGAPFSAFADPRLQFRSPSPTRARDLWRRAVLAIHSSS